MKLLALTQLISRAALVAAIAAGALLAGCAVNEPPYLTDDRLDKGLVLILPGVEGPSPWTSSVRQGLFEGGTPYALEIHNWIGSGLGIWYAYNESASRRQAGLLADRIADYRRENPGRPVFVVGISGGAAIAVFAAEATPEPGLIDGMILLATPLRPQYDLTRAVSHSRGHVVNYHTTSDLWLLGLTTLFRNLDGSSGATAGHEGFVLPEDGGRTVSPQRREVFAQMAQVPWDPSMAEHGNRGGHTGWTNAQWVAHDLPPILDAWADGQANREIFDASNLHGEVASAND